MCARIGITVVLLGVFVIGCEKAGPPTGKTAPTTTPASKPALTENTEGPPAQPEPIEAIEDPSIPTEEDLLAKHAEEPKNGAVLVALAFITMQNAGELKSEEDQYVAYKKSGDYLQKALEVDPDVVKDPSFSEIAGSVFYNQACAFSRKKELDQAVKSLTLAAEHGWTNAKHISRDPDLANLREDKAKFDEFLNVFREKRIAAAANEVEQLFKSAPKFDFEFELTDTEGKAISKKEYEGKVLLINIWGTWCGPCRAEIPELAAAYTRFKSEGFELVGLNSEGSTGDEANQLINESRKELGINYRCALATDKVFSQVPEFGAVPTSIFMDRSGKVRALYIGMIDEITLEAIIDKLLKEPTPNS